MSEVKWEKGPVNLASGQDAVIHRFCEKRKRYIGEHVGSLGGCYASEWNIAGEHTISGIGDPLLNLVPPPKKTVRVQRWMVVYPSGSTQTFTDQAAAISEASKSGFALIPIDREVEKGEGLA